MRFGARTPPGALVGQHRPVRLRQQNLSFVRARPQVMSKVRELVDYAQIRGEMRLVEFGQQASLDAEGPAAEA